MLVIPLSNKSIFVNLMPVTISLILINCLVFFVIQANDAKYRWKAIRFYYQSGLLDIERTQYIAHKFTPEQQNAINKLNGIQKKNMLRKIYFKMIQDRNFMEKLKRGEIITFKAPGYRKWKRLRAEYSKMISMVIAQKYGFIPAYPNLMNVFTSMFLHSNADHLIGNMIFLWLVGCLLEMKCGGIGLLIIYCFAQLGSEGLYWFFNSNSIIPCVGASGAISGLMGALTAVYGRKRVNIFFWAGFYFNYLKIPAVILLPFWVGKEIYSQIAFGNVSNVAYMAHVGGLITGAVMGSFHQHYFESTEKEVTDPQAETALLLEKALKHIRRLEMEKGTECLNKILEGDPEHVTALKHLFHIHKLNEQYEPFHDTTKRLLGILVKDRNKHDQVAEIYLEYIKWVDRPILPARILLRLMPILANQGSPDAAETILAGFLENKPNFPGLSAALFKLADTFKTKKDHQREAVCLAVLQSKFSDSTEAWILRGDLQSSHHSPLAD